MSSSWRGMQDTGTLIRWGIPEHVCMLMEMRGKDTNNSEESCGNP